MQLSLEMRTNEKNTSTILSSTSDSNGVTEQMGNLNSNKNGASVSTAVFHMLALSIGPTVFIIPGAFSIVGYIPAIIGIIVIGIFYMYNVKIILRSADILCKRKSKTSITYAELVRLAFNYAPQKFQFSTVYIYTAMNILFVVSWAGELSFGMVFISKNIKYILDWYLTFDTDIRLIVAVLFIPCTLIVLIPELKMTVLSLGATIIDILFIIVVLWVAYDDQYPEFVNFQAAKALYNIPSFLAIIFFTLNFTGIALPLKYDMKNPKKFDSKYGAFFQAMMVIIVINILFGFFGYSIYGNSIQGTMTLNLPHNVLVNVMIVIYCVAIFFTYPVCYFVIFNIVWNEWVKDKIKIGINSTKLLINVAIFSIIIIFPQLDLFTQICGLVCAVFDSIIMPSLINILLSWKEDKNFKTILIKGIFVFIIGVMLFICGLYQCIIDIVSGKEDE